MSTAADAILRRATEEPLSALRLYRDTWHQNATSSTRSSIEQHPRHEEMTATLQTIFDYRYRNKVHTNKDLRSLVGLVQAESFSWHEGLCRLGLYIHFGDSGCTRKFLSALRDLARLRDTDGAPLAFEKAKELLDEARKKRVGKEEGQILPRGISHETEWQPNDCGRAGKLAMERLGIAEPPKKSQFKTQPNTARRKIDTDKNAGSKVERTQSDASVEAGARDGDEHHPPTEQGTSEEQPTERQNTSMPHSRTAASQSASTPSPERARRASAAKDDSQLSPLRGDEGSIHYDKTEYSSYMFRDDNNGGIINCDMDMELLGDHGADLAHGSFRKHDLADDIPGEIPDEVRDEPTPYFELAAPLSSSPAHSRRASTTSPSPLSSPTPMPDMDFRAPKRHRGPPSDLPSTGTRGQEGKTTDFLRKLQNTTHDAYLQAARALLSTIA